MAPGVEVALGGRDPTFGPLVLVRRAACSECCTTTSRSLRSTDEARRLIDGLQIRPILDGVRGAPPADVDGLADAVATVGVGRRSRRPPAALDVNR
jgi:hypothetical protein